MAGAEGKKRIGEGERRGDGRGGQGEKKKHVGVVKFREIDLLRKI